MQILITIVLLGIFLILLDIFLLVGRTGNEQVNQFTNHRYAHRGLHNKPTIPENSLAAFHTAAEKGYAIELDVHLMKDGNIAVIHDSSLKRTTGYDVAIEALETNDLKKFKLEGSSEHIPTLDEVLIEVDGRVPLLIEIKTASNAAAATKRTVEKLSKYRGDYCIESFDPRVIMWLRKNTPHIVRGQLVQNFFKNKSGFSFFVRLILTPLLLNCVSRPDFIAVNYLDRGSLQIKIALKLLKLKGFAWTITNKKDLIQLEKEGYAVIFENLEP